jgi:ABC-type amino acid transport system permease subunit
LARDGVPRADPQYAVPGANLFHLLRIAAHRPSPTPTPTAIIALGVNGGAYAIEIIRGGVQSINKGQVEAGLALGLRKALVFRLIVLKPALRDHHFFVSKVVTAVIAGLGPNGYRIAVGAMLDLEPNDRR